MRAGILKIGDVGGGPQWDWNAGKVGSAQFGSLDDRLQLYTQIPEHNASIQDIVD